MMNNKKAVAPIIYVILAVIILVVVVGAAVLLGSSPSNTTNNGDVTVYIDSIQQTGNYSSPQTLAWGNIAAGNTYTKNFTVANAGTQAYNLLLLTTEPDGNTQSWAYNNTVLNAMTYEQGTLTLTLSTTPASGAYTWRLLATNSNVVNPTPTINPSATPIPNGLSFTINAATGVQNITVTRNNQAPFTLLSSDMPKTYTLTAGDNLKFSVGIDQYFAFNGWQFADGSMPQMQNPIILANIQGNFTLTATAIQTTG